MGLLSSEHVMGLLSSAEHVMGLLSSDSVMSFSDDARVRLESAQILGCTM